LNPTISFSKKSSITFALWSIIRTRPVTTKNTLVAYWLASKSNPPSRGLQYLYNTSIELIGKNLNNLCFVKKSCYYSCCALLNINCGILLLSADKVIFPIYFLFFVISLSKRSIVSSDNWTSLATFYTTCYILELVYWSLYCWVSRLDILPIVNAMLSKPSDMMI